MNRVVMAAVVVASATAFAIGDGPAWALPPQTSQPQTFGTNGTSFLDELHDDWTADAFTDQYGNQFQQWSQHFELSDLVFKFTAGSTYTLESGTASVFNLSSGGPPTQVENVNGYGTCTTTYAVDTSEPLTGTLTVKGAGADLVIEVPETYANSCFPGPPQHGAGAGLLWEMSALRLRDGFPYKLASSGSSVHLPAPNPDVAPIDQSSTGELYAEITWGKQVEDQKADAKERAEHQLDSDIEGCKVTSEVMAPLGGQFLLAMLGSNETMCEENARATYEEALKQIDPPDTSFNAVALPPASRALGNTASCRKLRGALKRKCAKILAASKLYERALNNWTAVEGAIDTTLNRGNTAEQQNSAPGEQLQQAALAVEGSEEQSADTALNSAGRALARALRTARINLALSARAAAEAEHKLVAGKLPASVLRQLAAAGITHTDLKSVFTTAFAHLKPGPLRLTASLATPIPSSNLPPEDLVTSPAGLTTLVQGLQNGGALSATAARSFETDINSYADADTAAAQAQALARLKSNSAGLPGAVGTFLITAVEGLG